MEELTNLIMGNSVVLDAYVIIRLVLVMMGLELLTCICGMFAKLRK